MTFDLFERMGSTPTGRAILDGHEAYLADRDGTARQQHWEAEDGWMVTYTTSRVVGGPHAGKFVVQVHKPIGPGARSGTATRLVETYRRPFATRKAARARAEAIYRQHSPKYAARLEGER